MSNLLLQLSFLKFSSKFGIPNMSNMFLNRVLIRSVRFYFTSQKQMIVIFRNIKRDFKNLNMGPQKEMSTGATVNIKIWIMHHLEYDLYTKEKECLKRVFFCYMNSWLFEIY